MGLGGGVSALRCALKLSRLCSAQALVPIGNIPAPMLWKPPSSTGECPKRRRMRDELLLADLQACERSI
jgi:hypothetical protein